VRLYLVLILIPICFVNAQVASNKKQLFLEGKAMRGNIISDFSKSAQPENREALRMELRNIQVEMGRHLISVPESNPSRGVSQSVDQSNAKSKDIQIWSPCELEATSKSLVLVARIYQNLPPTNKFWEGAVFLMREVTEIYRWLDLVRHTVHNNSSTIEPIEVEELFELLLDGSGLNILESLRRLEFFLESERITLILKYSDLQDVVAETFFKLHSIIESLEQAVRNEKPRETAILAIAAVLEKDNLAIDFREHIDFIMRVILEDIVFRSDYKSWQDIEILAAFDNINHQIINRDLKNLDELYQAVEKAKSESRVLTEKLNCESQWHSRPDNNYVKSEVVRFERAVFENLAVNEVRGKSTVNVVLKAWSSYIESKCLQLPRWQTNHRFWCVSDHQIGCERIFASVCKSTQ
jgi:hypothetical protein